MPNINITVRNKIASAEKNVVYICGNSDFVLRFDFDSEWNAFTSKTARISHGGTYTDVVFSGNECAVPVLRDVYSFKVGVYAGNLHTTTPATVFAKKSILCESGVPEDPAPTVYAQLMTALNGKANSSHTHSYNDLTNKPDIPEAYNDATVKAMIAGKADANHTHSYNSLTDKPSIPEAYDDTEVKQMIQGKADADHVHSYNDLTDKPVIPEAYDDSQLKSDITALPSDVKINGSSIVSDGVANIPIASQTELGVAQFLNANGIVANNGKPYINAASEQNISKRATDRVCLMPKNLNYAVTAALTDSNHLTMTSAQQDTACAVVGAERSKGEWVLKGTMTDPSGVNVDLNGCTELYIKGKFESTSDSVHLFTNIYRISYRLINATGKTACYGRWKDSPVGVEYVNGKTWNGWTFDYGSGNLNGDNWFGKNISQITKFYLSGNVSAVSSCNIEFYAR